MQPGKFTSLFSRFDREIWLVTARAGSISGGLIATFVHEASIAPEMPRLILGVAKQHHTWGIIEASGAFALHLISEKQLDWVWRFGLQSGHQVDKLTGLHVSAGITGSPLLCDALAWLECRVESRLDTGDRTVYLAEVVEAELTSAEPFLTVKRMLELAPPEKLQELRARMQHDGAVDAAAIRNWRLASKSPEVSETSEL
jgi:flavin reductase (DIM6/NTAB) family NADH-FMN oxidoreductase RutF